MTDTVDSSWPIRLKRRPMRLLAVVGVRALIGGAAMLTGQTAPGTEGTVLRIAGAIILGYAALLGLYLASLRLEARPGELLLHSLFGTRRYRLARGTVTRLWLPRSWRSPLKAETSGLGVRIGQGELKGEKLVGVVALDRSATLLMVPAVGGRLAVAAASEDELLTALAAATAPPGNNSWAPAIAKTLLGQSGDVRDTTTR